MPDDTIDERQRRELRAREIDRLRDEAQAEHHTATTHPDRVVRLQALTRAHRALERALRLAGGEE